MTSSMCKFHVDCGGTWHQHAPTVPDHPSATQPGTLLPLDPSSSNTQHHCRFVSQLAVQDFPRIWTLNWKKKHRIPWFNFWNESHFAMFTCIQSYLTLFNLFKNGHNLGYPTFWVPQGFQQATSRRCRGRTSVAGPRACWKAPFLIGKSSN